MRYLFLFFLLAAVSKQSYAQPAAAADSAHVVQTVGRFHAALAAGDSAMVAALLLPEATVLEGGGLETKTEYLGHHFHADHAFLSAMMRKLQTRTVHIAGDAAWVASTSYLHGTYDGRPLDLSSAELMVLRQTPDGWRIAAIHWSSRSRE